MESFKKDGTPKRTPVQSLEENGTIYFRTGPDTWKIKRIRRNPHVRVALCDRSGNPTGPWLDGDASIVGGDERTRLEALFRKEYGAIGTSLVNLVGRMRGERLTTFVSIKLRQQASE